MQANMNNATALPTNMLELKLAAMFGMVGFGTYLLQNVQFEGPLGVLVAIAIMIGILVAAIKGLKYLWNTFFIPFNEKVIKVWGRKREAAMLNFFQGFFDHQEAMLVLMFDEKKNCIYVSGGLQRSLHISTPMVQGRNWHRIYKDTELSKTLAKLDEAYEHQAPYRNLSTIIVEGQEVQFLEKGEPYIQDNRVKYYVVTLIEKKEPLQLKD